MFTCQRGNMLVYAIGSLFIFLSTFWSMEILLTVRNMLNDSYSAAKPKWVRAYNFIVTLVHTNLYAKLLCHGSVFVIVLVLPIVLRLLPSSTSTSAS